MYLLCVCVGTYCQRVHVLTKGQLLRESVLPFDSASPRGWTWVLCLGRKNLYLSCHLSAALSAFLLLSHRVDLPAGLGSSAMEVLTDVSAV